MLKTCVLFLGLPLLARAQADSSEERFALRHTVFAGVQLPLSYTAGYQVQVSPRFSARVQGGLIVPPFDRYTLKTLEGFGLDRQLTPATIEAVKRLEAAGIGFTVISARPRSGVQPIADALEIDGVIAAFNGGIIFKRDGTVTEHHTIDEAAVRGILALAEGAAVDTWLFADDQWFASTDQGAHVGSERKAANQEPVVDIAAAFYEAVEQD